MNLPLSSIRYMSIRGLLYGAILGTLAGVMTGFLITADLTGGLILGTLFGGGFGAVAGAIMGFALGILYGFSAPRLYHNLGHHMFRIMLTLFGGVGTAVMATRIPALADLLPFWGYVVIAGLAAGAASYRYADWYHLQQLMNKRKNKAAEEVAARLDDTSALIDDDELLEYEQSPKQRFL